MEIKNKNTVVIYVCGVLIFGVGFFAGMEYKAYQLRSALKEGMKEISGIMSGEKTTTDQKDELDAISASKLREKVDLEVTSKKFENGDYQDEITMGFMFTNLTEQVVRGVEGTMVFYDIFNNEIYRSDITYDEGIPERSTKTWVASIKYNQFMANQTKLKNTELENLKYVWLPSTIIYEDGTKDVE